MATLEKIGIPPRNIVFVEPFPDQHVWPSIPCFNDPDLDNVIQEQLDYIGISVYRSYYFYNWEYDEKNNLITGVKFQNIADSIKTIECNAMFFYDTKSVDYDTFKGNATK